MTAKAARADEGMRRRSNRPTLGSVAVEAALVLPVLMALSMAVIETGNMFRSWLTVHKAAVSGARLATTGRADAAGDRLALIVGHVEDFLAPLAASDHEIVVASWPGLDASEPAREGDPGRPCDMIEVRVSYGYRPVTPLSMVLPEAVVLSGKGRKVNEPWSPCEEEG